MLRTLAPTPEYGENRPGSGEPAPIRVRRHSVANDVCPLFTFGNIRRYVILRLSFKHIQSCLLNVFSD
jgi:hypothetical protein